MKWISCTDQLPDDDTTVITYSATDSTPVWPGYHEDGKWWDLMGHEILGITHWQHLPDPPTEASPPFQGEGQGGDGVPSDPEEVLP